MRRPLSLLVVASLAVVIARNLGKADVLAWQKIDEDGTP
jgi:hypothetical protein